MTIDSLEGLTLASPGRFLVAASGQATAGSVANMRPPTGSDPGRVAWALAMRRSAGMPDIKWAVVENGLDFMESAVQHQAEANDRDLRGQPTAASQAADPALIITVPARHRAATLTTRLSRISNTSLFQGQGGKR